MKWNKINESVLQNEARDFSRYGDSPEIKEKAQKIAKRIFSKTKKMRDALKEYGYAYSSELYRDLNTVGHVRITVYLTPSDNIYGGHYKSVVQFEASNNRGIGGWTANIRDDGTLRIGSSIFAEEVFEVLDTFKRFEKDFWNHIDQIDKDEMDTAYTESTKVNESFGGAVDVALGIALYKCIVGCIGAGIGLTWISGLLIKKHFDNKNVAKIKKFFQEMFDGLPEDRKEELRDMSTSEIYEILTTAMKEASTSDDAKVASNAKKLLEIFDNSYGTAIRDALDDVLGIKRGVYKNFRVQDK